MLIMRMRRPICYLAFLAAAVLLPVLVFILSSTARGDSDASYASIENEVIVIIDAGHGDPDGGAVAPDGTSENLINLDIAKRCEALFRLCGIKTAMTRTTPSGIWDQESKTIREKKVSDIQNRMKIINSYPNGIVISIHINKFSDSSVRGATVFYGDVGSSKALAECIQRKFRSVLPGSDKKVKPVPDSVYLFSHIDTAGVIAECGFISNPQDHQNLKDDRYREMVAFAIVAGYLQYLQN